MTDLLTASNITFVLGILAIIFSVYNYFKNPQTESEKKDALLEQKVQWQKEESERRFQEMGKRMDDALALAQNHTHTVDVKVDSLVQTVNEMDKSMTKIFTILEERLPRKDVV